MSSLWRAEQSIRDALQRDQERKISRLLQEATITETAAKNKMRAEVQLEVDAKIEMYRQKKQQEIEIKRLEAQKKEERLRLQDEESKRKAQEEKEKLRLKSEANERKAQEKNEKLRLEHEARELRVRERKYRKEDEYKKRLIGEGWTEEEFELLARLRILNLDHMAVFLPTSESSLESTSRGASWRPPERLPRNEGVRAHLEESDIHQSKMADSTQHDLEIIARELSNNKLSLDSPQNEYEVLKWAAKTGQHFLTKILLPKVHLMPAGIEEETPLQLAAQNGHLEVFQLILEKSCLIETQVHTALCLAISNRHLKIVKLLLLHTDIIRNIDAVGSDISTPLQLAIQSGDLEIVKAILQAGPSIRISSAELGKSPLHMVAEFGDTAMLNLLLRRTRINLDAKDPDGVTAVMTAVENNNLDVTRILLNYYSSQDSELHARLKIDINQVDKDGNTLLLKALKKGYLPLAQLLLDWPGLNANATDTHGWTALMFAASYGCTLSVSKLLEHIDIDVMCECYTTEVEWGSLPVPRLRSALDIARGKGYLHVVHMLSTFDPNRRYMDNEMSAGKSIYTSESSAASQLREDKVSRDRPHFGKPKPHGQLSEAAFPHAPDEAFQVETVFPCAPTNKLSYGEEKVAQVGQDYVQGYDPDLSPGSGERKGDHEADQVFEDDCMGLQTQREEMSRTGLEDEKPTGYADVGNDDESQVERTPTDIETEDWSNLRRFSTKQDSTGAQKHQSLERERLTSEFERDNDSNVDDLTEKLWDEENSKKDDGSTYLVYKEDKKTFRRASSRKEPNSNMNTTAAYWKEHSKALIEENTLQALRPSLQPATTTSKTPKFQVPRPTSKTTALKAIDASNTQSLSSMLTESLILTRNIQSVGLSDSVNWAIAVPATFAGILSAGFAGWALKMQRAGVQGQEKQRLVAESMNRTLQKMETNMSGILKIIREAERATKPGPNCSSDPAGNIATGSQSSAIDRINMLAVTFQKMTMVPNNPPSGPHSSTPYPSDNEDDDVNDDNASQFTTAEHLKHSSDAIESMELSVLRQVAVIPKLSDCDCTDNAGKQLKDCIFHGKLGATAEDQAARTAARRVRRAERKSNKKSAKDSRKSVDDAEAQKHRGEETKKAKDEEDSEQRNTEVKKVDDSEERYIHNVESTGNEPVLDDLVTESDILISSATERVDESVDAMGKIDNQDGTIEDETQSPESIATEASNSGHDDVSLRLSHYAKILPPSAHKGEITKEIDEQDGTIVHHIECSGSIASEASNSEHEDEVSEPSEHAAALSSSTYEGKAETCEIQDPSDSPRPALVSDNTAPSPLLGLEEQQQKCEDDLITDLLIPVEASEAKEHIDKLAARLVKLKGSERICSVDSKTCSKTLSMISDPVHSSLEISDLDQDELEIFENLHDDTLSSPEWLEF